MRPRSPSLVSSSFVPFVLTFCSLSLFSVVFRYTSHTTGITVIGAVSLVCFPSPLSGRAPSLTALLSQAVGALIVLIHPIPKSQRGGTGYMST